MIQPYEWGKDPGNDHLRLYAKLYYFLAAEMVDTFGEEGEKALRRAVQKFGASRGEALRKRHEEMGMPIDVKSLFTVYDLPSGRDHDDIRKKIQLDEDNRVSETYFCHLQQVWEELGGEEKGNKIGAIYCDEFHWSMWAAYHPDIKTELPQILTKHNPCCHFEVHRSKKDAK